MKTSVTGIKILRYLANHGLKIFTIRQAQKAAIELKLNPEYVAEALHHLLKGGWLARVKRGIYSFTADSGFGAPPHEFEISAALVSPSAISHWTAMHFHHLTQQTPNIVYAISPNSTSIPRSINRSSYHFIKIKKEQYFGIEKVWIGEAQINVTDPERTLLDGLIAPEYCGNFQEVLHAFKMRGRDLNLNRIIEYALRLDHATVKRLGWILEKLGWEDSELKSLLEFPIKGYRKLNPNGPSQGEYIRKWMIQENL